MNKSKVVVGVIMAVFLGVWGLTSLSLAGEGPIKIGCLFALSGPARHIGVPSKYVAEMAKEYFDQQDSLEGRQIELIFADTKGEGSVAISEFERLVRREGVCAVIGPTRTGTCMAMLRAIEQAKIPVIACVGGTPPVVPTREWVFKTPQKTDTAVGKVYEYLISQGINKVAIITSKDAFGEEGKNDLKRMAQEKGIQIVAEESFGTNDIDMTIQLRKLAASDAVAIICWTIGPGGATVARNFKSIGAGQVLIQCHGLPDPSYLELAGEAANGTMMPSTKAVVADQLPLDDPQREVVQSFVHQYEKEYGPVSTHSGYAWDAFMILVGAIKRAGTTEPILLREAIERTSDYVGVSGIYNMSSDDHCGLGMDSLVMVTVEDDQWKLIED